MPGAQTVREEAMQRGGSNTQGPDRAEPAGHGETWFLSDEFRVVFLKRFQDTKGNDVNARRLISGPLQQHRQEKMMASVGRHR